MRETNHAALTRRRAITRGLAFGAGLALGSDLKPALAQSTPSASPATTAYPQPEALIGAAALMARRDDPALTLIALMPADEFVAGHIPGSAPLDWPAMELTDTSDASVASWREEMAQRFAALGVTPASTVVTYDGGSLFATRPWWILHHLGHGAVRVLDGGLSAWQTAGGEIATGAAAPPAATPSPSPAATPAADPLTRATPRPQTLAQLDEVRTSLGDPAVAIVDARTPEEYAQGHIPGAVNVNYPHNVRPDRPHTWLPQDELRALYDEAGVTPDKRVIPYCTTGVRSSVSFFSLHLIGYDNVGLYTGSWAEWSRHPDLPVTTGDAP